LLLGHHTQVLFALSNSNAAWLLLLLLLLKTLAVMQQDCTA
jgi:hypothetical protein